ncbi:hypothetical protein UFB30_07495 [Jeotgalibacillus sp. HH7-29]|uniref:Uncharacterized protein n=1 Tax=Jeotgalibacillus haloalkalitolerans TaxID=3104292 RepID=A0ABU5KLF7_9BACL|nr:hypothetical protein [Jeotgalibacillus sp. HH7-29]
MIKSIVVFAQLVIEAKGGDSCGRKGRVRLGMAKPAGSPPGRGKRPPEAEIISQI